MNDITIAPAATTFGQALAEALTVPAPAADQAQPEPTMPATAAIPAALRRSKGLKKPKAPVQAAEQPSTTTADVTVEEVTPAEPPVPVTPEPVAKIEVAKVDVTRVTAASLLQSSVGQTHLVRQVISDAERLRSAQDCVDVLCIGITKNDAVSMVGRLLHPFSPIRLRLTAPDGSVQEYPSAAAMAIASIWPNMAEAAKRLPGSDRNVGRFATPIFSGPMAMDWLTAQCNTHHFNWMTAPDTQRWHLRRRLIEATWARLLCYSDSEEFQRVISALPVVPQMDHGKESPDLPPIRAKDLPLVMWMTTTKGERAPHPMSAWWVGVARKMLGWAGSAWRTSQANAEILNRHAAAVAEWEANGKQGRAPVQPRLHEFDPSDEIQRMAGFVRPLAD